jgi:hypothetical protein
MPIRVRIKIIIGLKKTSAMIVNTILIAPLIPMLGPPKTTSAIINIKRAP